MPYFTTEEFRYVSWSINVMFYECQGQLMSWSIDVKVCECQGLYMSWSINDMSIDVMVYE